MSISELSPWLGTGPALVPRGCCPQRWAVLGGNKGGLGELGERGILILFQSLRDLSHDSSKRETGRILKGKNRKKQSVGDFYGSPGFYC